MTNLDPDRLTGVVIDELRMLPKSCGQALNRAAFRGRSSSLAPVIAFQDWNSLLEVYGTAGANEVAANFQTKLFLRQGSDEGAEWGAKCLGKPEATWMTTGSSYARTHGQYPSSTRTDSVTEHLGDRFLVHPSQLRTLPLADRDADRIVGYLTTPALPGPTSFAAPFMGLANRYPPHPDFPNYLRRPAADQVAWAFSAADADALNLPATDELLAALAGR